MQIAVTKETEGDESRVALVPESIRKLVALNTKVSVESGAGERAGASDADYRAAGAQVSEDRAALVESADALVLINRPRAGDIARLKKGAVVLGFLRPLD